MRRSPTPLLWTLFSAGGTVAAIFYPVHLFLTGIAFPLQLFQPLTHERALGLASHPLCRAYLLVLIALPLFHWAHRFRYTLYDGLQLKHLFGLVAAICYGTALTGAFLGAVAIWALP